MKRNRLNMRIRLYTELRGMLRGRYGYVGREKTIPQPSTLTHPLTTCRQNSAMTANYENLHRAFCKGKEGRWLEVD